MKHGDISNKSCPIVLMKVEDTVIKREERKLGFIPLKPRFTLNREAEILLHKLAFNTEYSVVFTMSVDCPNEIVEYLHSIMRTLPFSYYRYYDSIDIKLYLESGVYFCYVDNDSDRLNTIGHKETYTIAQFMNLI